MDAKAEEQDPQQKQKERALVLEQAALTLAQSPDYRVLRRVKPRAKFADAEGRKLLRGIILDTETTGLDTSSAVIVEIAMVPFLYADDGQPVEVLEAEIYHGFQDPGAPLSDEVKDVTGLTDEDLQGKTLDIEAIERLAASADLIIAHKADYDRKLCERLSPVFKAKPWGCSYAQIPWKEEKIRGGMLEYIGVSMGYFFSAHRAIDDARALLQFLANPLPISDRWPLNCIREDLKRQLYAIWAPQHTPFGLNVAFKQMGYRWSERTNEHGAILNKSHRKVVTKAEVHDEMARLIDFLHRAGIRGEPSAGPINPLDRFSFRE